MKKDKLFEEFESLGERLGVKIVKGKGNFIGGTCLINEEKVIVVNKAKPIEQRLRVLALSFLEWDLEVGDCVYFDIRTLHGALHETSSSSDVNRFTLRMAKENSKIIYRGDWAREERVIMENNGYKNGDDLSGKMFPTLFEAN